jgi:hypothetical protein
MSLFHTQRFIALVSQHLDRHASKPTLMFMVVQDDTIRIMLATDNHLGVNERDPIRGQDSLNTFKEILQLAVKHDVSLLYAQSETAPIPPRAFAFDIR